MEEELEEEMQERGVHLRGGSEGKGGDERRYGGRYGGRDGG